jgi:hypothetical protein
MSRAVVLGFRKLIVCLAAILAVWIGALAKVIPGDTASWSIVAVVSVAVTGYAGEYFFNAPGRNKTKKEDKTDEN